MSDRLAQCILASVKYLCWGFSSGWGTKTSHLVQPITAELPLLDGILYPLLKLVSRKLRDIKRIFYTCVHSQSSSLSSEETRPLGRVCGWCCNTPEHLKANPRGLTPGLSWNGSTASTLLPFQDRLAKITVVSTQREDDHHASVSHHFDK